jgi:3'(2'), 5'-bisphosphate nucleotidase
MPYENELQLALDAVSAAQDVVLQHYARFEAIPDAPANITTETDHVVQELLLRFIHEAFPADGLRAEEATPTLKLAPDLGPRLWLVDPIDGTRGFARKNGEFAVMVGLVDQGRLAVGVVAEPARGRLTYASQQGGCWQKDVRTCAPAKCHVSALAELTKATLTQSHSRYPRQPSRQVSALKPARVIETYSAGVKLAMVARGEVDLYLNTYGACHDWDICAGQVLVDEAGGRVTTLAGESPCYGLAGGAHIGGILASNGHLHFAALTALKNG